MVTRLEPDILNGEDVLVFNIVGVLLDKGLSLIQLLLHQLVTLEDGEAFLQHALLKLPLRWLQRILRSFDNLVGDGLVGLRQVASLDLVGVEAAFRIAIFFLAPPLHNRYVCLQ